MPAVDIRSLQQALVDLLKQNGTLKSPEVGEAFLSVPRHLFVPNEPVERAYEDVAIQVRVGPEGRWTSSSSQPSMMAIMLEQLELRPGMRVLEIGAGTGFNAALMAHLVHPGGSVMAVDIQPDLVEETQTNLRQAGIEGVRIVTGDGGYGWPEDAPYDRIILTAASYTIAPAWREQLVEGGRLLMPFDLGGAQVSTAFEKRGEELVSVSLYGCGFMPLQGSFGRSPVFANIAEDVNLMCARECGLDGAALAAWLAQSGEVFSTGIRVSLEDLWSGLSPWLAIHLPERVCSLIAEAEDVATIGQPFAALQRPVFVHSLADRANGIWPLLPGDAGAALVRRVAGTNGEGEGPFEIEVVLLGDGETAGRALIETLQAWIAAGRPTQERLNIRAINAGADSTTKPRPGEYHISRPWTDFVISYRG